MRTQTLFWVWERVKTRLALGYHLERARHGFETGSSWSPVAILGLVDKSKEEVNLKCPYLGLVTHAMFPYYDVTHKAWASTVFIYDTAPKSWPPTTGLNLETRRPTVGHALTSPCLLEGQPPL